MHWNASGMASFLQSTLLSVIGTGTRSSLACDPPPEAGASPQSQTRDGRTKPALFHLTETEFEIKDIQCVINTKNWKNILVTYPNLESNTDLHLIC